MTLGRLYNLWCLISEHEHNNTHSPGLLWELNEIMSVKYLASASLLFSLCSLSVDLLIACMFCTCESAAWYSTFSAHMAPTLTEWYILMHFTLIVFPSLLHTNNCPLPTHHLPRIGQVVCWLVIMDFLISLLSLFICLSSFQLLFTCLLWEETRDGFTVNLIQLKFHNPSLARAPLKALGGNLVMLLYGYIFL